MTKGLNVISWDDDDRQTDTSSIVGVTYGTWDRGSPQPPRSDRDREETFPTMRAEFHHIVSSLRAQAIVRSRVVAKEGTGADRVSDDDDIRCP